MQNLFGISDDVLISGFDECKRDHNEMLEK